MPLSISQNSIMCMEHNEQYQMVCQAHDELVCPSCILNHDDCKGIVPLKKVIEHVKKSSLFQETKQSLKDIDQNIKMLQNELKKHQGSIKQQEETVFAKIRDTRHKVNAHLDKLEKKIRNEVSEITAKLINNVKQTIQLLQSRHTNIHNAEQQLQNMDRYGTDIQAYLGLRRISSEAASSCTYLQSIIADHGVHKITLLFNIDDKINNIYKSIGTFASIKVQKDTCHIPLVTHKNKQAQLVGTISKAIPAIKIRHVKTTKTGVSNIRGIVPLASGNIALSNYVRSDAGKVVIFSIDGGELMKVPVKPACSFDISYIDDRFLATTSPFIENKGVIIIDINEKKAAKFIPTNFQCYGIKHYDGKDKMASIQQHCDICDHRHITKPSTIWCPECKQAFCEDCNDYHGFSKSSENHVTVSIQDYLSMSSSISQTSNICMEHTEQYQMVCQAHDKLICPSCIENHEGCKGIVSLRKMTENVKKSSFFQETRLSLKDIDQNIKTLQIELNEQQKRIKQQEEKIFSQVTDTRKKIDDHFDKLEKKIKNEIVEITSESKDSIKNKLQILENKTDSTNKAEQQLQDMDRYATDLQTYFGLRKISLEAATTESYLQSIIGDHILDAPTILFNIDDIIDNLSSSIQSFGSLEVQKTQCKLSLVTHKTKQAQLVETKIRSIADIKSSLVKSVKPEVQDIRGIVVLPNGNIALSDYSTKNVLVFSTDWQILSKISVKPANAFDITYIDYKTVATTSNNEEYIGVSIIDIDTEKVTLIPTKYQCYGIKHHNGSLFICAEGDGICKLNPQDGRSTAMWSSKVLSARSFATLLMDDLTDLASFTLFS
ncbi:Hypothetical predicted protein [Mytilus galloprovincialis]|uniref:B box-type domain-containing protein n=1 Tax=Mytilus galloprovincialis TaxID=29158 RepID=A0A8B6HT95_MYTGA|nr:Hypothetical predicted protein [Mytilus galloprovincialis]